MGGMLRLTACLVDLDRRIVCGPVPVPLTCREADLLVYLAARPGRVVSRDEALREVFGYSDQVLSRAVDCVVRRLRAKIESDPDKPVHLLTEFGVGYRLTMGVAAEAQEPARSVRPLLALSGGDVDLDAGTIRRPEGVVSIVGNELALLRELVRTAGQLVDARQLERRVWGAVIARSNRLRSLVWRLRNKIERVAVAPDHLVSRRGSGYRFHLPEARPASVRATVVAATIGPDATGEATERLWAAAAEVGARCGAEATNLAFGQACLVLAGPATGAVAMLRALVDGVRIGVAEGEVRRVGTAGYVGEAVVLATTRARSRSVDPLGAKPGPANPVESVARPLVAAALAWSRLLVDRDPVGRGAGLGRSEPAGVLLGAGPAP
jgi:DNA-binding response OmpR family regulator